MPFNLSDEIRYPQGLESANQQVQPIMKEMAQEMCHFFSTVGVVKKYDVKNDLPSESHNVSSGVADFRYYIVEVADKVTITTSELVELASFGSSKSYYDTQKLRLKDERSKHFAGAVRFIDRVQYLLSKFGLTKNQISGRVVRYFIFLAKAILIRLWQKKLIVLPISVTVSYKFNDINDFTAFSQNNRLSQPPLYRAPKEYLDELRVKFTELFFAYKNAGEIEFALIQSQIRAGSIGMSGINQLLYCSQLYSLSDLKIESLDSISQLNCLWKNLTPSKPAEAAILKTLSSSKSPFDGFRAATKAFKGFCSKELKVFHADTLMARTREVTNKIRTQILALQSFDSFNYEEVIYEKDEKSLFEFFVDNNFSIVQKLLDSGLLRDTPNYTSWQEYNNKQFSVQCITTSRRKSSAVGWNFIKKYLAYVSCWIDMFPEAAVSQKIEFPTVLKDLDRETFVIRSFGNESVDTETWPRSMGEFLLNHPEGIASAVRGCLLSIQDNYKFVKEHVGTRTILLEGEYTQHWHATQRGVAIDSLKESVKKTLTRDEFPIVLEIAYALECYGSYIQERILSGVSPQLVGFRSPKNDGTDNPYSLLKIGNGRRQTPAGIIEYASSDTSISSHHIDSAERKASSVDDFDLNQQTTGLSPIVWFVNEALGNSYIRLDKPCGVILSIYGMYKSSSFEVMGKRKHLPLLGFIRGYIVALEQGIRHKHIRFLDARYFDKYVTSSGEIVDLLINTDKATKRPWKAPAHINVINILKAEREFLRLRTDCSANELVKYDSTKQEIDVLFRNASGKPFQELAWAETWKDFLSICQTIINHHFADKIGKCELVKMVPLSAKDAMNSQTVEQKIDANSPFVQRAFIDDVAEQKLKHKFDGSGHRVKLLSLVTPHGTRTTFISHRIHHMPLPILAKMVNHQNIASTVYYGVTQDDDINNIMAESRAATNQIKMKDSEKRKSLKSSDIRPSDVKDAFESSPKETANLYGFTSVPLVTIDEEGDEISKPTGLELINEAARSTIAYSATHICLHNLECPSDIILENGGLHRCGVCRIKVCHIDNVVSISRLCQKLSIDIVTDATKLKSLNENPIKDGNIHQQEAKKLKQEISVQQSELIGWTAMLHTLEMTRKRLISQHEMYRGKFVIPAPKLLSSTIVCQTTQRKFTDVFFNHMLTVDDIPSLNSKELEPMIARLSRQLMVKAVQISPEAGSQVAKIFAQESLDPRHLLSPIISLIDSNIITTEQVYQVLDATITEYMTSTPNQLQKKIVETLSNEQTKRLAS